MFYRSKILLALIILTLSSIPFQYKVSLAANENVVLKTFSFNWNDTIIRVDVHYLAEVEADTLNWVNVSVTPIDFGGAKKIRIEVLSIDVSNTVISKTVFPFQTLYWAGSTYRENFKLNFSDPSFNDIVPGNINEYTLNIKIEGSIWDENEKKYSFSFQDGAPIYIKSPVVDLYAKIFLFGDAYENGNITIQVYILNVGVSPARNLRIHLECDGIDFKTPNIIRLPITLNPGDSLNVSFKGVFEEMGGWLIRAYISYLNSAGYNSSLTASKLVDVKGASRIELYENFSKGALNLWGRLIPPRIGASVKIYMSSDGVNWTNIASLNLETTGYFQFSMPLPKKGIYFFKAAWDGDGEYLPSSSRIVKVNVPKNTPNLILTADLESPVKRDRPINLILTLPSFHPSSNSTIILFGRFSEDADWTPIGEIKVNSTRIPVSINIPSYASIVEVKGVLLESEEYYGVESNILKLKVEVKTPIYFEPIFIILAAVLITISFLAVVMYVKYKRSKILS